MERTEINIPKGVKATMYQDGDKIVIEYEQEFKRGDFIMANDGTISILGKIIDDGFNIVGRFFTGGALDYSTDGFYTFDFISRLTTDQERQQLIDALHKEGKDWDAEKMEIVDWGWRPKYGERYYIVNLTEEKMFHHVIYSDDAVDKSWLSRKIAFRTKEEAIACAKKMLAAI